MAKPRSIPQTDESPEEPETPETPVDDPDEEEVPQEADAGLDDRTIKVRATAICTYPVPKQLSLRDRLDGLTDADSGYEDVLRRPGDVFTVFGRWVTVYDPVLGRAVLDENNKPVMRWLSAREQMSRAFEIVDDDTPESVTGSQAYLDQVTNELASAKRPGTRTMRS